MSRLEELKSEAAVYLEKVKKLNEEIDALQTEGWALYDKAEFYVQYLQESNKGTLQAGYFRSDLGSVTDALNPFNVDLLEAGLK